MPMTRLDGMTQLEYIERGQGEPLVLVHGTLGDFRSWDSQMSVFADSYRTISYSRRYHHPNDCKGEETNYSAALHADDLASFITALGPGSANVVGNSYGAYTALLLAARHPERVRTVVLGDPPVFPFLGNSPQGRSLRDDFLAKVWEPAGEMMREGRVESGVRIFVDGVVEEGVFDRFPQEVRDLIMDNACEFKVETSSPDFWTPFTREDAGRVEPPISLLTGDQSLPMFQVIVDELDRHLPNSESKRVPDTTHEVSSDNPDVYNEMVLDILARHSA